VDEGLAIHGSTSVNRLFYFPVFAFLSLTALLLLLSGQFSRFSAPHSTLESGKAIDEATAQKAALINPPAAAERDLKPDLSPLLSEIRRFRLSGVAPSPHTVEIEVSANDQGPNSSIDTALNKVTPKLRGTLKHQKDRAHPPRSVKSVSRHRPTANLLARIRCWLVSEFGLARPTNGRPRKEIRTSGRSIKKRLTTPDLATAGLKAHRRSGFLPARQRARAEAKTFLCGR
jgi:hypothetical protein